MNDLLSEDTPISDIQSRYLHAHVHVCISWPGSHWLTACGSACGLCSSILNRPALTDSTPSTNRFVDSNCIQRLHNVSFMFDDAPVGGNDATHLCIRSVSYTLSLPFRTPPSISHRDASRNTFTSLFRISCVVLFSPCNTIRLAAGSDNAYISLRRYHRSNFFVSLS
jgi:hypothetical protein